jgi:hypothetical protein
MALATGGGGKVRSRPRVLCAFIEANAESLDGFFPPLPSPLPEAGALAREINMVTFLIAVRLYARRGRALRRRDHSR